MLRDVEITNAECEVDRIDVVERRRETRSVCDQEEQREREQRFTQSNGAKPQGFVQAAEPVATQVDRHVGVADGAQLAIDRLCDVR